MFASLAASKISCLLTGTPQANQLLSPILIAIFRLWEDMGKSYLGTGYYFQILGARTCNWSALLIVLMHFYELALKILASLKLQALLSHVVVMQKSRPVFRAAKSLLLAWLKLNFLWL